MIELFDCNLRLGMPTRPVPGEPTTVRGLLDELDRLSVSHALVRHQGAVELTPPISNRRVLQEVEDAGGLLPTWSLLPESTGETGRPDETVDEMIGLGVRAVWLHPKTHGYPLRDWCAGSLLSALEDRRVPVLVLWTEVVLDELVDVLGRHPALPVVLCNISYRINRVLFPLFERHAGLHVDLGPPNAQCGFIEEVVGRFGAGRLLFGSGFPDHEMGPAISYLMYADVGDDDRERIGSGNLRTLLEGVT